MSISLVFFIGIFLFCIAACLFVHPVFGVCGYVFSYVVSPATQWWGSNLAEMGIRYSFMMAVVTACGMLLQSGKLTFPGKLYKQEILFFILIVWIFATTQTGPLGFAGENYALKLLKVAFFLWMLVRIVDSQRNYEIFLWAMILATAYLGYDSYFASTERFGRIDRGVGGSDFFEGNFLAAHFAMVLPFLGIFIIGSSLKRKLVLFVSAVLIVNGIILCRSRGAFVALGLGFLSALYFAPKGWRSKILGLVLIGFLGSLFLVDEGFVRRMQLVPDTTEHEFYDSSVGGRILAWQAALEMAKDHPLGVGQGNFFQHVGLYQPDIPGKDTHNTYLRALAELGIPGLGLIVLMIANAFWTLVQQKRRIDAHGLAADLHLHVYAQGVALVIFLAAGMFITHTYIEELYWLLMLPVLLERVVDRQMVTRSSVAPVAVTPDNASAAAV